MSTLSKKEWEGIRDSITRYNPVILLIDGHRVEIRLVESVAQMRLYYQVWIDGSLCTGADEKMKDRFWFRSSYRLYRKDVLKGFSKRTLKKAGVNPDAKGHFYSPHFRSFRSLRSVLGRNGSIEILDGVKPVGDGR